MPAHAGAGVAGRHPEVRRRRLTGERTYACFLLPALLTLGVLSFLPILVTISLSLTSWNLMVSTSGGFVGLENYGRMLADRYFGNAVVITLILILGPVAFQMLLGLGLALLLHRDLPLLQASRAVFITPMVIPPVIAGLIWKVLLIPNLGGVNYFLGLIGMSGPNWLETPIWALIAVGMVAVWEDTPFVMLLLLAALESLPPEPFEAATVDGASSWQRLRYVTIPLIMPTILVALLFRIIASLNIFPVIYVMTKGGPGRFTEVLNYYAFTHGFQFLDIGYAAALAMALFVLIVALSGLFMLLRMRFTRAE